MGPPPTVTGISPKEATAGMKITIRGENLGVSPEDLLGVLVLGCDALMTVEWKSQNKITALCPGAAKEGKGVAVYASEERKYNMRSIRCFRGTEWVERAREA